MGFANVKLVIQTETPPAMCSHLLGDVSDSESFLSCSLLRSDELTCQSQCLFESLGHAPVLSLSLSTMQGLHKKHIHHGDAVMHACFLSIQD